MPAPCKCHARVGIQPGRIGLRCSVSAQGILRRLCVLCLRGLGGFSSPYACTPCRAKVGIEPNGEVRVVSTRSPVLPHSPDRPVPALWSGQAKVGIQPGGVVRRLHIRAPVLPHSPVHPVPPPRTRPPLGLPSLVGPVAATRTRLSLRLLPPGSPACPALPESPSCPEPPEPPVS